MTKVYQKIIGGPRPLHSSEYKSGKHAKAWEQQEQYSQNVQKLCRLSGRKKETGKKKKVDLCETNGRNGWNAKWEIKTRI